MSYFNSFRNHLYRFFSKKEMAGAIAIQPKLNRSLLRLFKQYGGTKTGSPVEFFFYTDTEDKANNLVIELVKLKYEIYGISSPAKGIQHWCIIGVTTPLLMNEYELTKWCEAMNRLGYETDCRFDGWGTLIE
ncbi:MAG: ribonuclease E inhibitor RraB [Bacteroidota bacterium]|nr:ribonuclease E inhibitor RraB [Bacteroidota bacterium]